MGMYTEIVFNARLKEDIPQEVVEIIKTLASPDFFGKIIENAPNHAFFKTERQWFMRGSSYYFPTTNKPQFKYDELAKYWSLSIRSNIKNYNSELEKFLDWIKPYIESGSGPRGLYATTQYEEDDTPTSYYLIEEDNKNVDDFDADKDFMEYEKSLSYINKD